MSFNKQFTEIRQKLRNNIKRTQREKELNQKRVQFMVKVQNQLNSNSTQNNYQQLFINHNYSIQQRKAALIEINKQISTPPGRIISNQMFLQIMQMIKNNTLISEVISFLYDYVYVEKLPQQQLQIFYNQIGNLIKLIDIHNSSQFGDIISIIGNTTIDDSRIKYFLISSGYFNIVEVGVHKNLKDLDFVQTALWQIKNLFMRTKIDKVMFKLPPQFIDYLVSFIKKLFVQFPNPQNNQKLSQTIRQCLIVIENVLYSSKELTQNIKQFIIKLIDFLDKQSDWNINTKIIKEIIKILVLVCDIQLKCFESIIINVEYKLVQQAISTSKTHQFNNSILDLAIALNCSSINTFLIKSIDIFSKSFQNHQQKLKWSNYLLNTILKVKNIQYPTNQLQTICKQNIKRILSKINLFLLDQDSQIIYNGVRILYYIISNLDQAKSIKDILEQEIIISSLQQLQLHPNKDIYQIVQNIFQLLGMTEGDQ